MLNLKNPDSDYPIIELYEPIGVFSLPDGSSTGVSGNEVASALAWLAGMGKKGVDIYINSDGGSVSDGLSMYSAIKSSPIPVNVVCTGVCVSMAGVVLQAGKKRQMVKWGSMMIHPPAGGTVTDLVALKETLIKMLCESSEIPESDMEDIMDKTTWLNAETCLSMNLIDEIVNITPEEKAPEITDATTPAIAYKSMMSIVNSLPTIKKTQNKNPLNNNKMDKILSHLNLASGSTESDVLNVIKKQEAKNSQMLSSIHNARKAAAKARNEETEPDEETEPENAISKMKKEMDLLVNEVNTLRKNLKDKTAECANLTNEKNAAENKSKETEAENAINKAITDGKLTNESKDQWKAMFIADEKMTTDLLAGMVGVRRNPKITVNNGNTLARKNDTTPSAKDGIINISETEDGKNPFKTRMSEVMKKATEAQNAFKNKPAAK